MLFLYICLKVNTKQKPVVDSQRQRNLRPTVNYQITKEERKKKETEELQNSQKQLINDNE